MCVGKAIANNSLFISIALCLWAFSLSDSEDKKLDIGDTDDDGLTMYVGPCLAPYSSILMPVLSRPKPFPVNIQPRSPEVVSILAKECEARGR